MNMKATGDKKMPGDKHQKIEINFMIEMLHSGFSGVAVMMQKMISPKAKMELKGPSQNAKMEFKGPSQNVLESKFMEGSITFKEMFENALKIRAVPREPYIAWNPVLLALLCARVLELPDSDWLPEIMKDKLVDVVLCQKVYGYGLVRQPRRVLQDSLDFLKIRLPRAKKTIQRNVLLWWTKKIDEPRRKAEFNSMKEEDKLSARAFKKCDLHDYLDPFGTEVVTLESVPRFNIQHQDKCQNCDGNGFFTVMNSSNPKLIGKRRKCTKCDGGVSKNRLPCDIQIQAFLSNPDVQQVLALDISIERKRDRIRELWEMLCFAVTCLSNRERQSCGSHQVSFNLNSLQYLIETAKREPQGKGSSKTRVSYKGPSTPDHFDARAVVPRVPNVEFQCLCNSTEKGRRCGKLISLDLLDSNLCDLIKRLHEAQIQILKSYKVSECFEKVIDMLSQLRNFIKNTEMEACHNADRRSVWYCPDSHCPCSEGFYPPWIHKELTLHHRRSIAFDLPKFASCQNYKCSKVWCTLCGDPNHTDPSEPCDRNRIISNLDPGIQNGLKNGTIGMSSCCNRIAEKANQTDCDKMVCSCGNYYCHCCGDVIHDKNNYVAEHLLPLSGLNRLKRSSRTGRWGVDDRDDSTWVCRLDLVKRALQGRVLPLCRRVEEQDDTKEKVKLNEDQLNVNKNVIKKLILRSTSSKVKQDVDTFLKSSEFDVVLLPPDFEAKDGFFTPEQMNTIARLRQEQEANRI